MTPASKLPGRIYLDLGDALAGDREPPEPVTVLVAYTVPTARPSAPAWPWLRWSTPPKAGGPLNVAVRRTRGDVVVIPTRRGRYWRIRIPREQIDPSAVAHAYDGSIHRGCDWPGCPALMDIITNMEGGPGSVKGWFSYQGWRMCPRHATVWLDGTHKPAWDRADAPGRPRMVCSCSTPLPGRTLGDITRTYRTHLAALGES